MHTQQKQLSIVTNTAIIFRIIRQKNIVINSFYAHRFDLKDSRFLNEQKSKIMKQNSTDIPDNENCQFCPLFE